MGWEGWWDVMRVEGEEEEEAGCSKEKGLFELQHDALVWPG